MRVSWRVGRSVGWGSVKARGGVAYHQLPGRGVEGEAGEGVRCEAMRVPWRGEVDVPVMARGAVGVVREASRVQPPKHEARWRHAPRVRVVLDEGALCTNEYYVK